MSSLMKSLQTVASNNSGDTGVAPASLMPEVATMSLTGDETFQISDKYVWYNQYMDTNYSVIDERKNIKLDVNQINITQEENSQIIPFQLNRYYDGVDLMDMNFRIYFVNSDGNEGFATPINVMYSETKIRFYWMVGSLETAYKGKLAFEIHASGVNEQGLNYMWKTRPNEEINVLQSLAGDGLIEPDHEWYTQFVRDMDSKVSQAQKAATQAQTLVTRANAAVEEVEVKIENVSEEITVRVTANVRETLSMYYTKEEVDALLEEMDFTELLEEVQRKIDAVDGLAKLNVLYDSNTNKMTFMNGETEMVSHILNTNPTAEWTTSFRTTVKTDIDEAVKVVSDNLAECNEKVTENTTAIENINKNHYNKTEVDNLLKNKASASEFNTLKSTVSKVETDNTTNKSNINLISGKIAELEEILSEVDTDPSLVYDVDYDAETGVFQFIEIEDETETVKRQFTITGGSGGGTSGSSLKITYVTTSPVIATVKDKLLITYNFSGTDSSGDIVSEGNYTWKIGSKIIATGIATNGENTFDATSFATTSAQKITLTITDDNGSIATKSWTIQQIDVRLESTFSDVYQYNGDVSFSYTPYGSVEKEIHFVLDGEEIGVVTTTSSGVPASYTIPSQEHGAHLLDVYMTATINNNLIESNNISKDIIWIDPESSVPVIGCATPTIDVVQYNTVNIKYVILDPSTETPEVTWYLGDEVVSVETLTQKDNYGYYTYTYKANSHGTFTLTAVCGEAEPKVITINVEKLNIDVSPVTAGLEFDFNPTGRSNNSDSRLWSYNDITMSVSDNFDWINGGYQLDENGDMYFCVKAGTNAVINYNLFADDPKKNGKEFKLIFRTKNIRKRDTSFLTCMNENIGLDMKVEHATVYDSGGSLKSNYCEDSIIEYEFNINKDTDMMIVMSYEDGTPSKPYEYTETSSFTQTEPQPITIGSEDCDILIYRMKVYSTSLSDTDIKNNFIADARNADEIISRYNRNQIYTNGTLISTSASGDFNADALMKAAPDLRYIFLEVPRFTYDKEDKVDDCTVYFRYPNGTRPQDNWTCTGVRHRGQGTSSNLYGYAGRNIDLVMDRDNSLFTYIDEEGRTVESSTIALTDTSYPTDYLNIKVNIASSENANNAEMARRFNEFQPFLRYARKKDSRVKDTMEFYNCAVFIRETSTDATKNPHQEFNDTNWHFYGIGNVGDSKKTDDTRVNNKREPRECVVEITDADKPLSAFPTGKAGHAVCPVDEWKAGNTAYDILYSTEYVYDEEGAFESFGGETYEFRYEMKNITQEQREENINAWRDLYTFIATSTDEEFYANLKDYFVVDSALYFYLFTERYTMVDNRAKNSFWHYGKVYISNEEATQLGETEASYYIIDDEAAAIRDGFRWDLTFGYDMDTALGIDNTGDYVFDYGKEDTDYYVDGDPTSDYVFRVADSVFFCRLRDLFPSELQAMYKDREEKNAWNSNSLITQWDNSQKQFPEELWRLDYERKYYRTYLGLSIDNSITKGVDKTFLIGKFFGRKKYARRAFEINQEMYFATKYFGNKALADVMWVRGNVPIGGKIAPDYSLTLVPYSDMYVCVKYSSTGTPIHKRVKAGETCYFKSDAERMDFIYIYAASFIQEVGDLSRCFVGDNNFTSATRLQKLVVGSTAVGYENTFMKEIVVANNPLLEHLDLRNITGLNTVINVSKCNNLKELYAENTNATGAIFANGGLLQVAHLPKVTSLSMKNLNYLEDFVVEGYDNLQTLIVENTPSINTYDIVSNAPALKTVRLIGLNWSKDMEIPDTTVFERLITLRGVDADGYNTAMSVLNGYAHIIVAKQKYLADFNNAWSNLVIEYDTLITQYAVTFQNYDGTVLDVQYIDKGANAVDPTTRPLNPIAIPTKPSSTSTDYTFSGWDLTLDGIFANRTLVAQYAESVRNYTVKYMARSYVLQETVAPYGSSVAYNGEIPTYTDEEPAYVFYLFKGWDQSGYVSGDKTINAVYDRFEYTDGCFDNAEISQMTPVQIYAMTKVNKCADVVEMKDSITFNMGTDYSYSDIEEELLISEKTIFGGNNYIDTNISLLETDRDWVLAVDYEWDTANVNNSVLMQCYQGDGSNGFKLWYSTAPKLSWGTNSTNSAGMSQRDMLVLRHLKDETQLRVYKGNLPVGNIDYSELKANRCTAKKNTTLVFGCSKADDGAYENYAKGKIYWCKVWYSDLGEDACRSLAGWTHETINLEMTGFKKYYLADGSGQRSNMTFLSSHLLSNTMAFSGASTNAGGWAASSLNVFLNTRFYEAIPVEWKQLIKQVKVTSTIGNKSHEVSTSNCYVYIPSVTELDVNMQYEPYSFEGEPIPYIVSAATRVRTFSDGTPGEYHTRSPHIEYDTYIYSVTKDGILSGFNYGMYVYGVAIMLSL